MLSRILYQQQQTLPSADELEDMTNRIADLRLSSLKSTSSVMPYSKAMPLSTSWRRHTSEVNDEVHDALLQVVEMRRELLIS